MPDRHALARVVVPLLVVVTALVVMVVRLGEPSRIIFDEVYYVNDARDFLELGVEDGFVVHPPLGKLLIAGGIRLVGDSPLGWRIVGALAGVVTVWLVYLLGRRLFRRTAPAALAALLLAIDGVFLVQARTAMLDVFLALFTVLGAYLLVRDRDQVRAADDELLASRALAIARADATTSAGITTGDVTTAAVTRGDVSNAAVMHDDAPADATTDVTRTEPETETEGTPDGVEDAVVTTRRSRHVPARDRTWLWLAGVAFGAAVAVKWSGLLGLGAAGLLLLGWELGRRHRLTGSAFAAPGRLMGLGLGALVLVPVLAYGLTWVPWFQAYENSYQATKTCDDLDDCDVALPSRVADLGRFHVSMANFHLGLEADHPYRAPAYTWPLQTRPVVYYYESCGENRLNRVPETDDETGEVTIPEPCAVAEDEAAEMLAVGNPALWWGFFAALPLLVLGALRRDRRSMLPLVFYAVQFLPWLIVSRPVFSFYTVPIVPFVALGLGAVLANLLDGRTVLRGLAGGASAAALGAAVVGILDAVGTVAPTRPVYLVVAGVGWALGGALALPGDDAAARSDRTATTGRWVLRGVALAAVGLAVFFLPVWTGVELPTEIVKQRWWFRGWI